MSLREKIIAKIDEWDANVPEGPEELADMIVALIGEALPKIKPTSRGYMVGGYMGGWADYYQAMIEILGGEGK